METLRVASLMAEGIVISLEMIRNYKNIFLEMGDCGSKSVIFSNNAVKEQRVDGSSIYSFKKLDCKVYSNRRESRF
jgi:hypothetical protein